MSVLSGFLKVDKRAQPLGACPNQLGAGAGGGEALGHGQAGLAVWVVATGRENIQF